MKRLASSVAELRPTLVIGVGGTGYLGVTSVKDKMMQMLPELVEEGFVRFQVIDTPSQKIRKLPPSEYFSCGGYNANRILDAMHRGSPRRCVLARSARGLKGFGPLDGCVFS